MVVAERVWKRVRGLAGTQKQKRACYRAPLDCVIDELLTEKGVA